jgi:hypothetical protein
LIVLAKNRGNSGEFSFRSHRSLAENLGLDRVTSIKTLRLFADSSHITLEEFDNGLVRVTIPKYLYYQEHKKGKELSHSDEKPAKNQHPIEKSREENIREYKDTSQNSASSDARELAEFLRTKILENKPDRKLSGNWLPKTESEIDRMILIDKRDPDTIHRVIEWCQADNQPRGHGKFCWALNILSGEKLRRQFDRLESEMTAVTRQESGARDF